jgi:hypothetical protein
MTIRFTRNMLTSAFLLPVPGQEYIRRPLKQVSMRMINGESSQKIYHLSFRRDTGINFFQTRNC